MGCGTGDLVRRLSRRSGHVTGLDADAGVLETAQRLTTPATGVDLRCGDLLTAELPGGYDAVTAVAVLHHVPLDPALTRLRGLLAPGGTLIVIGLHREEAPTDLLLSCLSVPLNLVVGTLETLRRGSTPRPVALSAPTTPATATLREIRDVARRRIPGATVRRHLFWRYSLRYNAPREPS